MPLNNLLKKNGFRCLFLIVAAGIFPVKSQSVPISAIELRTRLVQIIDSLDTEKQIKKRNGNSIEEIESKQAQLYDSLKMLRNVIQTEKTLSTTARPDFLSLTWILHPETYFDWILIVIGSIAIVSGSVLIIAIINLLRKKLFSRPSYQKTARRQQSKPKGELNYQSADQSADQHGSSTYSLYDLKRKIKNDTIQYEPPNSRPPTRILKAVLSNQSQAAESEIEPKVIESFRNGTDIPEISRQLQISVDHVKLILKVAGISVKQ